MLEEKKHAFWQALLATFIFFLAGLVLGIYIEQMRTDGSNVAFYQSETFLYDSFALGRLSDSSNISCGNIIDSIITLADNIYAESTSLEEFSESNKLTNSIKTLHKKYDLLRTILWMNIISAEEKCGKINSIIYLYNYQTDDLAKKSNQAVWSRVLQDLKAKQGNNFMLIPIAADQEISSLDYLTRDYKIASYPAVIINEKTVLYEPETAAELEKFLSQ